MRIDNKYEYRIISKEEANEIINKMTEWTMTHKAKIEGIINSNWYYRFFYDPKSKYNYVKDGNAYVAKLIMIFSNEDDGTEIYAIIEDLYKERNDLNIKHYSYEPSNGNSNILVSKESSKIIEEFINITSDEFDKYIKSYEGKLIHIENLIIDEIYDIYFDPSDRKEFSIDVGEYTVPRILFKSMYSPPACVGTWYVNKVYLDYIEKR